MEHVPSAEARAWGKKKATERPRWSDQKWRRIGAALGVEISGETVKPFDADSAEGAAA
ncbi:hypothetical protein ACWDOR_22450 [Streptosporangium canum]